MMLTACSVNAMSFLINFFTSMNACLPTDSHKMLAKTCPKNLPQESPSTILRNDETTFQSSFS